MRELVGRNPNQPDRCSASCGSSGRREVDAAEAHFTLPCCPLSAGWSGTRIAQHIATTGQDQYESGKLFLAFADRAIFH